MKKSMMLVLVVGLVAVIVLYSSGYFGGSKVSEVSSIAVVTGWNDIVIPDNWLDTNAREFVSENPSITTVSYWSTDHWVSYHSVIPNTNVFTITSGMELKVLATGNGIITAPR